MNVLHCQVVFMDTVMGFQILANVSMDGKGTYVVNQFADKVATWLMGTAW